MKKISIISSVSNGNLKRNRNLIKEAIQSFEGKEIEITIQKKRKLRSNPQNKYYFGVIVPIFQNCIKVEWGEILSIEEVHNFLKTNCNYEEKVSDDGLIVRTIKSTTENTTVDQENFHSLCRTLANDFFNTEIPLPNTEMMLDFN